MVLTQRLCSISLYSMVSQRMIQGRPLLFYILTGVRNHDRRLVCEAGDAGWLREVRLHWRNGRISIPKSKHPVHFRKDSW